MLRLAILCTLALAFAGRAAAQVPVRTDLMKTPGCVSARQQLDQALAAGGPRDRLQAAKRQAALSCLGISLPADGQQNGEAGAATLKADHTKPAPAPRNRVPPPPLPVEPIRLRPTPMLAPITAPAAPPPALPAPPGPAVITTCDDAGCWDSKGIRYNQQGPVLLGPRGVCTRQGGLLNCP
jgi:hypothetical protein